jgi:hypothetical protein
VDANHKLIVKKIEEKMNNNLKNPFEKQLAKKRPSMSANEISNFWGHRSFQEG